MEPDYLGFASSINPIPNMAENAKGLAVSDQLAASRQAGLQQAGGDWAGAAKTLYGSGDLANGQVAENRGAAISGAAALADRDYAGAAKAAAGVGDTAGVASAHEQALQQFQLRQSYIQRAFPVLQAANAKYGAGGIVHALDQLAPELTDPIIGFKPEQLAEFKQRAASDPNGFLASVGALAQKQLEFQKVGDDVVVLDKLTGQPVHRITGTTRTVLNNPNGSQSVTEIPGQDIGMSGSPIASAIFQQESGGNPNSPTSVDGAVGQAQILPKTFAQYAKPGEEITNPADNAAVGQRIIADLSSKYNNDPARVAVAYFSGPDNVAPEGSSTPWLRDTKDGNGKSVSSYVSDIAGRLTSDAQPTAQPVSPQPGAARVVATSDTGQPAFRVATPAENVQFGNPGGYGQFDAKGEYKTITKAGDVNHWTPDAIESAAQQYRMTGNLPVTKGQGAEAAEQSIINRASELDKTDGVSPAQAVARRALVNGTIKAQTDLIDVISKMQSYERNANRDFDNVADLASQALATGSVKTVREIQQWIKEQRGDTALGKFNVALTDAKGNYNKIVLGSGTGAGGAPGSVGERDEIGEKLFSDDLPLKTFLGNIEQARVGMANRMEEQTHQYQINDDIIKTGKFDPTAGQYKSLATDKSLPTVATPDDYGKIPPGAHYRDPAGNVRVKPK